MSDNVGGYLKVMTRVGLEAAIIGYWRDLREHVHTEKMKAPIFQDTPVTHTERHINNPHYKYYMAF